MKIRTHLCNENKFNNKPIGHWLWAARWWLYLGQRRELHAEWYLFHKARNNLSCWIEWGSGDGDNGIMFHAAIPWLFSIFIGFEPLWRRWIDESRQTGFGYYGGSLSFYPFAKTNSWASKDPWWSKSHSVNPMELVVGRWKYCEEDATSWRSIDIPMPEGKYPGKLRMFTGVWKNRFRTKRIRRAEIEMDKGIPFPGKGENSWDCGEDATYGLTCAANNEWDAIGQLVSHVFRSRILYGSWDTAFGYKPEREYVKSGK